MMYFNKDRIYVTGAKCAAIYDLQNNVVYSINSDGRKILDRVYEGKEVAFSVEEEGFLNNLLEMGLLTLEPVKHTPYLKREEEIKYVWLELTDACNLRCVHCYGDFGYTVCADNNLTTDKWKEIIKEISGYPNAGIQFIGGEPLAYKGFVDLLKYAHECGVKRIDVFTNATLLTKETIKHIAECNASVRVSIYGHTAEIHDKITQVRGSFEKMVNNVKLLVSEGVKVKCALIVMKENESFVSECLDFATRLFKKNNGYDVIRNTAPGEKNQHYVKDFGILKPRYQTYAKFFTSFEGFYHNHFYNSCWSGKLSITSCGDIIPCIFARQSVCGNIKETSLNQILNNLEKEWAITKDKVEVCRDCEYRYACHDCRPTAWGVTGNYFSKHERCTYDPYSGEWLPIEEYTREIHK